MVRAAYAPTVSKGPCVSKKPCTRWEFLQGFGVSRIMRIHELQNNVGPKVFVYFPKGPCTQIVDTLAPKYPNRDYFTAKVSTIGGGENCH